MDHIYATKDYQEYQVKASVEKLQESVISDDMPSSFQDIARVLNITQEKLKSKSLEICKLYEDYGSDKPSNAEHPFNVFPQEAFELNCIKFLRRGDLEFKENRIKERPPEKVSSHGNEDIVKDIEAYKDCVITVRFYEPFKYTPSVKNQPRFHQEYLVLGSNLLSDLRDKFYCQCNFGPFFDISENPKTKITKHPNQPDPGFFYIHDTFYNDTRNEANPDYSEVILNWSKKFRYVREFSKKTMQETKFEDLKLRIGYPCVYQHHGACEHVFCITSVDLIDNSDSLVRSDYPKLSYISRKRPILCDICAKIEANYLVTNCALHVKDPTRMCEKCFFSFHYIDEENKTCEFKAYKIYSVIPESENQVE